MSASGPLFEKKIIEKIIGSMGSELDKVGLYKLDDVLVKH